MMVDQFATYATGYRQKMAGHGYQIRQMLRTLGMDSLLARCVRPFPLLPHDWTAIPLRLIVSFRFLQHGCAKLARGPGNFVGIIIRYDLFSSRTRQEVLGNNFGSSSFLLAGIL